MRKAQSRVLLVLAGGLSFWGPMKAVEILTRKELHPAIAIFGPPITFLIGYLGISARNRHYVKALSLWMLIGVYVLGPWFIAAGASTHGGGFAELHGWRDWRWLFVSTVFPPLTLLMSVYDFSVLGILGTTAFVPILYNRFDRKRPVSTLHDVPI